MYAFDSTLTFLFRACHPDYVHCIHWIYKLKRKCSWPFKKEQSKSPVKVLLGTENAWSRYSNASLPQLHCQWSMCTELISMRPQRYWTTYKPAWQWESLPMLRILAFCNSASCHRLTNFTLKASRTIKYSYLVLLVYDQSASANRIQMDDLSSFLISTALPDFRKSNHKWQPTLTGQSRRNFTTPHANSSVP